MIRIVAIAFFALTFLLAAGQSMAADELQEGGKFRFRMVTRDIAMQLSSPAFKDGGAIPAKYARRGAGG